MWAFKRRVPGAATVVGGCAPVLLTFDCLAPANRSNMRNEVHGVITPSEYAAFVRVRHRRIITVWGWILGIATVLLMFACTFGVIAGRVGFFLATILLLSSSLHVWLISRLFPKNYRGEVVGHVDEQGVEVRGAAFHTKANWDD